MAISRSNADVSSSAIGCGPAPPPAAAGPTSALEGTVELVEALKRRRDEMLHVGLRLDAP